MKKSVVALSVMGALSYTTAHAQSSVTIYGIVDTGIAYSSKTISSATSDAANGASIVNGNKFLMNSGIVQGSRIGFKGVEDLGGGLSAIFNLETGFNNDTGALQSDTGSTNLFRRKSVVGLQGNFGSVTFGRQTDMLDDIGGSMTAVGDFGGWIQNSGSNLNRLQGVRSNNSVRYTSNNFGGFTGSVIYGLGEQAGSGAAGQAFGAGLKYENGPLALAAAYYQSKIGSTPSDVSLTNGGAAAGLTGAYTGSAGDVAVRTFTLAGQYQLENAKIYGSWSRTKQPNAVVGTVDNNGYALVSFTNNVPTNWILGGANNNKTDTFEIGGSYMVTPALKLMAAVDHSRISYVDVDSVKGKLTQYSLGADYFLSKRTDVYAFVGYMKATDTVNPGITGGSTGTNGSQTALAVGVRHKF